MEIDKIAIVGPAFPLRGGIAAFGQRLAQQLQEMGNTVRIFSFSLQYPDFLFPGETQYASGKGPEDLDINPVINSINPLNWPGVARKIIDWKPDLVVFMQWLPYMAPSLGSVARLVRRKLSVPQLAMVHNFIPHEPKPWDRMLTRYFASQMDGYLVMSGEVKSDLLAAIPDAVVEENPHPIYDHYGAIEAKEIACRALKLPVDNKYALFFGLIRKYKGLDLLIEALRDPQLEREDLHLLVGGEFYDDEAPYQDLIRQLNLEDRVHIFKGFVPDQMVAHFFNASDFVALPYRSATQSGVSQIAMHFRKPMLVTQVGGLAEVVTNGPCGLVAQPAVNSLREAMVNMVDSQNQEKFQKGLDKVAPLYSWEKMGQILYDLAEKVK